MLECMYRSIRRSFPLLNSKAEKMPSSPQNPLPDNNGPQDEQHRGGPSPSAGGGQPRPEYSTPRYDDPRFNTPAGSTGGPGSPHQYSAQQGNSDPGFFSALFDLSFRHFITLKFATFIYILAIIMSGLGAFGLIIVGIASDEPILIFLMLIMGAVSFFANIVLTRVVLELVISMIRTAQNTSAMVDQRRPS